MWSKIKGWFGGGGGDGGADGADGGGGDSRGPKARWLEPEDPGNPFGVRLLDLMANLSMVSMTRDPELARRAVSWRPGTHREVAVELDAPVVPCACRFPVVGALPDGLLFRPLQMEDKWVLVYRDGVIAAARSWTGETGAVARVTHEGDALVVNELRVSEASGLSMWGDAATTFEWLVRTHALGERIPLPVSAQGADLLHATPLVGFPVFGRHLFCAAVDYEMGEPARPLVSDGDLVAAVAAGDAAAVDALLEAGADVDAPCSFGPGASVLHLAIHLHPELVGPLIAAGASVDSASFRGSTAIMAACAAGADASTVERLLAAGADLHAADRLGFTALHVAAQFGRDALMELLVEHGADLEARTAEGYAPVHVAAGTGQGAAIEWLIARGMDMSLDSPRGTALEIARSEGHAALAERLASRAGR